MLYYKKLLCKSILKLQKAFKFALRSFVNFDQVHFPIPRYCWLYIKKVVFFSLLMSNAQLITGSKYINGPYFSLPFVFLFLKKLAFFIIPFFAPDQVFEGINLWKHSSEAFSEAGRSLFLYVVQHGFFETDLDLRRKEVFKHFQGKKAIFLNQNVLLHI